MSLLDAPEYDPRRERRRRNALLVVSGIALAAVLLIFYFRNWPAEHRVSRFFDAIEHRNYETAYGLWYADPDWKQHPEAHANYTFNEFLLDWGPSGEYGEIKSHEVVCSARAGSGIVVAVSINHRVEPRLLWVESKDKTINDPPGYVQLKCR
jgi:hypothetical protein